MNQIRKLWDKYYDYIIIALIYGLLHILIHTDYWDDAIMSSMLKVYDYDLFAYLGYIWQNWGSLLILHTVEVTVEALPNYIWKILDIVIIEIIYHYLSASVRLLTSNLSLPSRSARLWMLLFFLSFPYSLFATAGWMTTTIAYAWTFAAFFYSLYLFLAASKGLDVKWFSYIIYAFAVVYCANCYLVSFAVFMIFLYIYIMCKSRNKSFQILFVEGMAGSILNIVLFFISPGNSSRNIGDAKYHDAADILSLSFGGHMRMGINTTYYHFVSIPNIILFTFCLVLMVCTFYKTKNLLVRGVSCIPLALDVLCTGYLFFACTIPNRTLTYIYPDAAFLVCPQTEQYLMMASALLMVLIMCYLLIYLTDFSQLSWITTGTILVLGLLPNVALGFTATVSASIMRTATFFYFSIIFCTGILVIIFDILKNRFWRYVFYILGCLGTLLNILQIVRHIMVYG